MTTAQDVATRLIEAYRTGVPIPPVRDQLQGIKGAYDVQQASVAIWERQGRRIAGAKIGLTAKVTQEQFGVNEPDYGTLFADMILKGGAQIARGAALQARIEAEIAFVMKRDLDGTDFTPEAVIAATDYVVPAVEVVGSRIANWDIRIEDTIADNASSAFVVAGSVRRKPVFEELAAVTMTLYHNGNAASEGKGTACLGNPAISVAWLAGALTRLGGRGLRAGDFVMSGALSRLVTAAPGDRFIADFAGWDKVAVNFAA